VIKLEKNFNIKKDSNLIYNDAFLILPQIPNNSIDHCITDPPYNISGYDYKKEIGWLKSNHYWTDKKNFLKIEESWDKFSDNNYGNFTKLWLNEIFRILKPNGNIIVFGTYHNIYKIGNMLQESNKKIINSIVWFKNNAFPNITQRMLCESTEYAIWAVNNSQEKAKNWTFNYKELKDINIVKVCDSCKKTLRKIYKYCPYCGNINLTIKKTQMRNFWEFPSTSSSEKINGKHPAQKPMRVISRMILGGTKEKDIIIDPFMGSGTIPLVSRILNRRFIGIEKDEKYSKIAYKRLNEKYQLQILD